jgi:autotransporter-associated beta strand protein
VLSGTGGSLTKVGTGSLTLSGASSNTYTGTSTFASNGQLILSKTGGAVAIPGDFIMAAPGTRGIVSTTEDNQFGPGSVLRFTSAGDTRLELKGTTQTFGGIENASAPAHTYHAIQHSEFGSPGVVDSNSQVILNVAGANSFTFNTGDNGAGGGLRDYNGGVVSLVKNGTGTQTLAGSGNYLHRHNGPEQRPTHPV